MKKNNEKFDLDHKLSLFFAVVIGLSLTYLAFSAYTSLIKAQQLNLGRYLSSNLDEQGNEEYPDCPNLVKVELTTGAWLVKDTCTNNYWHSMDLPLIPQNRIDLPLSAQPAVSDEQVWGYTWKEAKNYCNDLARTSAKVCSFDNQTPCSTNNDCSVIQEGSICQTQHLFRLPTTDELLSLVEVPCTKSDGCSPLIRKNESFRNSSDPTINFNSNEYTIYNATTIDAPKGNIFANGLYWTADEVDLLTEDDVDSGEFEGLSHQGTGFCSNDTSVACDLDNECLNGGVCQKSDQESAQAVNLYLGSLSSAVLSKDVRLNVRCIVDKPLSLEEGDNIENVFWSQISNSVCQEAPVNAVSTAGQATLRYTSDIACSVDDDCPSLAPDFFPTCQSGQCVLQRETNRCLVFSCDSGQRPYKVTDPSDYNKSVIGCQ